MWGIPRQVIAHISLFVISLAGIVESKRSKPQSSVYRDRSMLSVFARVRVSLSNICNIEVITVVLGINIKL